MNKYEEYLKELLDDQEITILKIEHLKESLSNEKRKHVRDYYKRELNSLYGELCDQVLDIQQCARHLME